MANVIGRTITEADVFTQLRAFLMQAIPGIDVIKAQVNRVPEPRSADFILMTPLRKDRIETNDDEPIDVVFTASATGTTLGVSAVQSGIIIVQNYVFADELVNGSKIVRGLTGTGGVGTYQLADSTFLSSRPFSAGYQIRTQPTLFVVQLDVHGPNSGDNAQIVTTLFRDPYATDFFDATGFAIAPLHADQAREMPFVNDQQQYEYRWIIEASLQANIAVLTGAQQFSSSAAVTTSNVEATFPQ